MKQIFNLKFDVDEEYDLGWVENDLRGALYAFKKVESFMNATLFGSGMFSQEYKVYMTRRYPLFDLVAPLICLARQITGDEHFNGGLHEEACDLVVDNFKEAPLEKINRCVNYANTGDFIYLMQQNVPNYGWEGAVEDYKRLIYFLQKRVIQ